MLWPVSINASHPYNALQDDFDGTVTAFADLVGPERSYMSVMLLVAIFHELGR